MNLQNLHEIFSGVAWRNSTKFPCERVHRRVCYTHTIFRGKRVAYNGSFRIMIVQISFSDKTSVPYYCLQLVDLGNHDIYSPRYRDYVFSSEPEMLG